MTLRCRHLLIWMLAVLLPLQSWAAAAHGWDTCPAMRALRSNWVPAHPGLSTLVPASTLDRSGQPDGVAQAHPCHDAPGLSAASAPASPTALESAASAGVDNASASQAGGCADCAACLTGVAAFPAGRSIAAAIPATSMPPAACPTTSVSFITTPLDRPPNPG